MRLVAGAALSPSIVREVIAADCASITRLVMEASELSARAGSITRLVMDWDTPA